MGERQVAPQGVFSAGVGAGADAVTEAAGAWADAGVTGTEMAAPTAVAAMASVIVEPEKRSSMVVSLCFGVATVADLCSRMLDISEEDLIQALGALGGMLLARAEEGPQCDERRKVLNRAIDQALSASGPALKAVRRALQAKSPGAAE